MPEVRRLSLLVVVILAGAAGIATLAPGSQASRPRITMSPAVARLVQELGGTALRAQNQLGRSALRALRERPPSIDLPANGYSCEVAAGKCSLKPCIKYAGAAPAVQRVATTQSIGPSAIVTVAPAGSGCRSTSATVPASLPAAVPQARPVGPLPVS